MAIIKIPSKKIYDNPRHGLSKNYINKVEAKEDKLNFEKDYNITIGSFKKDISNDYQGMTEFHQRDTVKNLIQTAVDTIDVIDVYIKKTSSHVATFPTITNKGKKKVVSLSNDQDGVSVLATKTKKTYYFSWEDNFGPTATEDGNSLIIPTEDDIKNAFPDHTPTEEVQNVYEVPQTYSMRNASVDFGAYPKLNVSLSDDVVTGEAVNQRVYASVSAGYAQYYANQTYPQNSTIWREITYETYIPKELSFSVKGDTEEYKDASENKPYGDGNDYFKMSTNELMQETAELDGVPVVEANANAIISEYKNGKETYELLCSIGEYYDNDNVVSVSVNDNAIPYINYDLSGDIKVYTKKDIGIFNIGDLVVPYKPNASGDVPISFKSDGKTPKIFRVVGVTPIFDGAVWQLLNLLETNLEEQRFATAYVSASPHTSNSIFKPIRFYSYVENTYNLGDEVKEVYYKGKKLPEEYANGVSIKVEYYNGSEIAYHYAYFKDGVLTVRTVSSTDNISGSLSNWNGVTPEVQPTTLTFELKKS